MGAALALDAPVTIEEYYAFIEDKIDYRLYELVDGEIVLNATPTEWHQAIVQNICVGLDRLRPESVTWRIRPGLGVRMRGNANNEPVPDVLIMAPLEDGSQNWTSDVSVVFEVLSRTTARRDMTVKRDFYTSLDPLTHYVIVAQDRMEAHVHARSNGFEPTILTLPDDVIALTEHDVEMPLAALYRDVPV